MHRNARQITGAGLVACLWFVAGAADSESTSGLPVLLEGNFMVADAMNTPFATSGDPHQPLPEGGGPGRVVEYNIFTGERGVTLSNPFNGANAGSAICRSADSGRDTGAVQTGKGRGGGNVPGAAGGTDGSREFACPGPWKPTGLLFGGENGHAYITSAGQHGMTEFLRDGTPVRSVHYSYPDKDGNTIAQVEHGPGGTFGKVPRPLGTLYLPNGLIAQAVCDANFFNAANSDPVRPGEADPAGDGNSSNLYFPPVYATAERESNSRILIMDPDTLEVVDEITQPGRPGDRAHDLWGCMAGMVAGDGALWMSTFHKAAVFRIDWRTALADAGASWQYDSGGFKYNNPRNRAPVLGIVDMLEDGNLSTPPVAASDPRRRDSMRAISLDSSGTLFAARRARSRACLRGEIPGVAGGCNPSVFRQRVDVVAPGQDHPTGSIALDPGVNIIAGIRINRISGAGCKALRDEALDTTGLLTGDECDVETLYVSASAVNPGCETQGGNPANRCFIPGGRVLEYRIDPGHFDDPERCSGDPADGAVSDGGANAGCAMPVATFRAINPETGLEENLDPRMLMAIHEPFMQ